MTGNQLIVSMLVGNYNFETNIESFSISNSLSTLPSTFSARFYLEHPVDFRGSSVVIKLNGSVAFKGVVNWMRISRSTESNVYEMGGRSLLWNMFDCSVQNLPGSFQFFSLEQLANTLCSPYNITVSSDGVSSTTSSPSGLTANLSFGSSPYNEIMKWSGFFGKILVDNLGTLQITDVNTTSTPIDLNVHNIKDAEIEMHNDNLFNVIDVSQVVNGIGVTGEKAFYGSASMTYQPNGYLTPISGNVSRVKYIYNDSNYTSAKPGTQITDGQYQSFSQNYAQWVLNRSMGESQVLRVVVPSAFCDSAQTSLWAVNSLVNVNLPDLLTNNQTLLVESIDFSYSFVSGSNTTLSLMQSSAFEPQPSPGYQGASLYVNVSN